MLVQPWHPVFITTNMASVFDYSLNYAELDLRKRPELYRTGKGEQGVLLVEPYKSEILPHWRFRTPQIARKSSRAIYKLFEEYRSQRDFAGMDMARKFLQMGYTRSRRYANHRSGKKYNGPVPANKKGVSGAHGRKTLPPDPDEIKAQSASIFLQVLNKVKKDRIYLAALKEHRLQYG